jgi:diketogulonate reductase-like aldo/keto reductase
MLYRRFGRTELQMPVFSCGGMRYQYKWQDIPQREIPQKNQENLEATIKRAVEIGINHIETARDYGTSEIQLGQILPTLKRENLIVQTKLSPQTDANKFQKTFEQSLRNLRLDYVDLLGLHGINNTEFLNDSIRPGGCLDGLLAFRLMVQQILLSRQSIQTNLIMSIYIGITSIKIIGPQLKPQPAMIWECLLLVHLTKVEDYTVHHRS